MDNKKAKKSNRLGRGLSSLIPEINSEEMKKEILNIDIDKIYPNQEQPRRVFDDEKIAILSESIKSYGVLQPIVVKPMESKQGQYMIIAGERRYRASKLAQKTEIPAIIKDIPMKEIMEIALIENLQREDLSPIEEAIAYKSLINNYHVTQEELSEAVGKSRPHITNTLRLLNLSKSIVDKIDKCEITAGHGKAILRIHDKNIQEEIANKVIEEELSVRATEEYVKKVVENIDNDKDSGKEVKKKERDIFVLEIEDKLTNRFGTKVNISKGKKKGKIEIEYYNEEDLNHIVEMLLEQE